MLPEEDHLLGPGQNAKVRRQPQFKRVVAEDAVAKSVERAEPDIGVSVGDEHVDAFFHLRRRFVGEGERENLRGARAPGGDQPGDAAGDDCRLAGAGPRDNQQRAGLVGHRAPLLVVQIGQDAVRGSPGGLFRDSLAEFQGKLPRRLVFEGEGATAIRHQSLTCGGEPRRSCKVLMMTPVANPRRSSSPASRR